MWKPLNLVCGQLERVRSQVDLTAPHHGPQLASKSDEAPRSELPRPLWAIACSFCLHFLTRSYHCLKSKAGSNCLNSSPGPTCRDSVHLRVSPRYHCQTWSDHRIHSRHNTERLIMAHQGLVGLAGGIWLPRQVKVAASSCA